MHHKTVAAASETDRDGGRLVGGSEGRRKDGKGDIIHNGKVMVIVSTGTVCRGLVRTPVLLKDD